MLGALIFVVMASMARAATIQDPMGRWIATDALAE
jgi:hypothetical protein